MLLFQFDDAIKPPMKKSLKLYYTGDTGKDATTLAWNAIMGLVSPMFGNCGFTVISHA